MQRKTKKIIKLSSIFVLMTQIIQSVRATSGKITIQREIKIFQKAKSFEKINNLKFTDSKILAIDSQNIYLGEILKIGKDPIQQFPVHSLTEILDFDCDESSKNFLVSGFGGIEHWSINQKGKLNYLKNFQKNKKLKEMVFVVKIIKNSRFFLSGLNTNKGIRRWNLDDNSEYSELEIPKEIIKKKRSKILNIKVLGNLPSFYFYINPGKIVFQGDYFTMSHTGKLKTRRRINQIEIFKEKKERNFLLTLENWNRLRMYDFEKKKIIWNSEKKDILDSFFQFEESSFLGSFQKNYNSDHGRFFMFRIELEETWKSSTILEYENQEFILQIFNNPITGNYYLTHSDPGENGKIYEFTFEEIETEPHNPKLCSLACSDCKYHFSKSGCLENTCKKGYSFEKNKGCRKTEKTLGFTPKSEKFQGKMISVISKENQEKNSKNTIKKNIENIPEFKTKKRINNLTPPEPGLKETSPPSENHNAEKLIKFLSILLIIAFLVIIWLICFRVKKPIDADFCAKEEKNLLKKERLNSDFIKKVFGSSPLDISSAKLNQICIGEMKATSVKLTSRIEMVSVKEFREEDFNRSLKLKKHKSHGVTKSKLPLFDDEGGFEPLILKKNKSYKLQRENTGGSDTSSGEEKSDEERIDNAMIQLALEKNRKRARRARMKKVWKRQRSNKS